MLETDQKQQNYIRKVYNVHMLQYYGWVFFRYQKWYVHADSVNTQTLSLKGRKMMQNPICSSHCTLFNKAACKIV